jgi:hypothetical protein
MKWTVKLVGELGQGEALEREIATIEREDQVGPTSIGLTIAEGKSIMEGLQRELVTAQMERHGAAIKDCPQCGRAFRTKGYYQSTPRSVYGKIRMRVRRIRGCSCSASEVSVPELFFLMFGARGKAGFNGFCKYPVFLLDTVRQTMNLTRLLLSDRG